MYATVAPVSDYFKKDSSGNIKYVGSAGTLTLEFCNCHIYDNHIQTVKEHIEKWKKCNIELPNIVLDKNATVFNFMPEMAVLDNYQYEEKVSFPIAV